MYNAEWWSARIRYPRYDAFMAGQMTWCMLYLSEKTKENVRVKRSLMSLVHDYNTVMIKVWLAKRLTKQNTIRHVLNYSFLKITCTTRFNSKPSSKKNAKLTRVKKMLLAILPLQKRFFLSSLLPFAPRTLSGKILFKAIRSGKVFVLGWLSFLLTKNLLYLKKDCQFAGKETVPSKDFRDCY